MSFSDRFVSYKMTKPPKFLTKEFDLEQFNPTIPSFNKEKDVDFDLKETEHQQKQQKYSKVNFNNNFNMKNKETVKAPQSFEDAFNQAVKINPEIQKYKNWLFETGKVESSFKSVDIQNSAGKPYYGWFQMGAEQIHSTTGLTVEQFRKDPVQQILGAVQLYKTNLKTLKSIGAYDLCKAKGYSEGAMMAGAWLGGPGGVKKFITGKGNPSDVHGTSVGKRMNLFNSLNVHVV